MPELYQYKRGTNAQLRRKAADIIAEANRFAAEAERVNERSITWLKTRAAANLTSSIAQTGREGSTGRLQQALLSPDRGDVHDWNARGFSFMNEAAMSRKAIYWRVIETGTRQFIGDQRVFAFYGPGGASRARKQGSETGGTDRIYGPRLGSYVRPMASLITIRRPIQPHRYARNAIQSFEAGRIYGQYMSAAVRRHRALHGRVNA